MKNENESKEFAIDVQNIEKKFRSYQDKATSLKERFLNPSRRKHEDVMVLKGISFQVKKGEAVGLIGKNGCGKSTTLKLLTRILKPTAGQIIVKGRVSSLIELGAGFHPDMTGRENIYTNASIFGLTRKEVDKRLNDIIRFSELEQFIDNPVRTYSSGMYMRLAFAVAINVDADVLLIDEILAVGDSAFQKKCFEKLQEIKRNGTTIVIVSHSMEQMYKICDRLIWIEDGLIKDEGTPRFIGEAYLAAMEGRRLSRIDFENQQRKAELERKIQEEQARQAERQRREEERKRREEARQQKEKEEREQREEEKKRREEARRQKEKEEQERREELERMERERREMEKNETLRGVCKFYRPGARRTGKGEVRYTRVALVNSQGEETSQVYTGEECKIVLEYESDLQDFETKFVVGITRVDGIYCYGTSVNMNKNKPDKLSQKGRVEFSFRNTLLKGSYLLDLWLQTYEGYEYDGIYGLMQFDVDTVPYQERGFMTMEHVWIVNGKEYEF